MTFKPSTNKQPEDKHRFLHYDMLKCEWQIITSSGQVLERFNQREDAQMSLDIHRRAQ